ncbi:MAG: hypothetical protein GY699_09570 [Desulfobacteraceae bacterium]|nr:hypothetical protein [Desulfobacteraceae bacterium]
MVMGFQFPQVKMADTVGTAMDYGTRMSSLMMQKEQHNANMVRMEQQRKANTIKMMDKVTSDLLKLQGKPKKFKTASMKSIERQAQMIGVTLSDETKAALMEDDPEFATKMYQGLHVINTGINTPEQADQAQFVLDQLGSDKFVELASTAASGERKMDMMLTKLGFKTREARRKESVAFSKERRRTAFNLQKEFKKDIKESEGVVTRVNQFNTLADKIKIANKKGKKLGGPTMDFLGVIIAKLQDPETAAREGEVKRIESRNKGIVDRSIGHVKNLIDGTTLTTPQLEEMEMVVEALGKDALRDVDQVKKRYRPFMKEMGIGERQVFSGVQKVRPRAKIAKFSPRVQKKIDSLQKKLGRKLTDNEQESVRKRLER